MKLKMGKTMLCLFLMLAFCMVGLMAEGSQEDQNNQKEREVFVFKYGNQQPESHSRTQSMIWFKKELEKRTDNRIIVEVYHSGTLGNEKEMFEMTVTGVLQGYRGAFYDQLNSKFMIYNLPFLFRNYDEMIHFNSSKMAERLCQEGSVNGIYIPAVGYTGFRTIINRKSPILNPEDLKGKKMRSPGQIAIINFYKLMGANPQEMSSSDVYMAMKQGVVDGACSAATDVESYKWFEVGPYYTELNYMAGADPLMVNNAWYQALPNDLKEIFNQVSKEALALRDQMEKKASADSVARISASSGVETIILADYPDVAAKWQKACNPLWEEMVQQGLFSWDDINEAQEIIDEVR